MEQNTSDTHQPAGVDLARVRRQVVATVEQHLAGIPRHGTIGADVILRIASECYMAGANYGSQLAFDAVCERLNAATGVLHA